MHSFQELWHFQEISWISGKCVLCSKEQGQGQCVYEPARISQP